MNAVQIVTIKSLRTLYKNGEAAERIELANVEEHGFDIVVQKGLYVVGSHAIYIQPDYCLPMPKEEGVENTHAVKLFLDFTMPDGDVKKSKLGKNGRIRAIKFNFQLDGSSDPVYSVGIMMPIVGLIEDMMSQFLRVDPANPTAPFPTEVDWDAYFEVTKYEEPETAHSGLTKGLLPAGMYATDETNIKNLRIQWPMTLTGTVKVDGSSVTIYHRDDERQGICSRNLEKKCDQEQISGYIDPNGNAVRHHYDKDNNVRGWLNEVTNEFFPSKKEVDTVPDTYKPTITLVDDTFVKLGKPILAKLGDYCKRHGLEVALRGELCGTGLKGSGNKNNPHSKLPQQIIFYAADDYRTGVTRRMCLEHFYGLINSLGLVHAPIVFRREFASMDELSAYCNAYFKENLIEGIVVKNEDASFSAKFMNDEYDSKK